MGGCRGSELQEPFRNGVLVVGGDRIKEERSTLVGLARLGAIRLGGIVLPYD